MGAFILKRIDEDGSPVEVPPSEPYWVESPLELTLYDMAMGTSKDVVYRLYNNLSHEENSMYSTYLVYFDFSDAFTKFEEYRYDTDYDHSLRKFIKFSITLGSLNSDIIGNQSYEVSSVYHAVRGEPIVGLIFTKDSAVYASLISNPNVTRQFIVLPFFPNPGDYFSFRLSIQIPSKLEEDFLGQAGGFPPKQGNFKAPYREPDVVAMLGDLQKTTIADNAAKKKYVEYFGPISPSGADSATEYTEPFISAMLTRQSIRGFIVEDAPISPFSLTPASPIFLMDNNDAYLETPSPSYYDALPTQVRIDKTSSNAIDLSPQSDARTISQALLEMMLFASEYLTYLRFDNPTPAPIYLDASTKIQDILNYHAQNFLDNIYDFSLSKYSTDYSSFNDAATQEEQYQSRFDRFVLVVLAHFFKAISDSGVLNTLSHTISPPTPIPDSCLSSYFEGLLTSGCDGVEIDLGTANIKGIPNSSVLDISEDSFITLYLVHYLTYLIENHPNLTSAEKSAFSSSFDYGKRFMKKFASYLNKYITWMVSTINEGVQTGSASEFIPPVDSSQLFKIWLMYEVTDQILGLDDTQKKQDWHFINKYAEHYGVYTNLPIKVLTFSKPVEHISDNITAVLSDLNTKYIAVQTIIGNGSLKQIEKMLSFKLSVTAII